MHAIHTACGIETSRRYRTRWDTIGLHAIHTACGIETFLPKPVKFVLRNCMQFIPLAVLKLEESSSDDSKALNCMQFIPLAVLKLVVNESDVVNEFTLHAIHTACGIETTTRDGREFGALIACNSYRLRY